MKPQRSLVPGRTMKGYVCRLPQKLHAALLAALVPALSLPSLACAVTADSSMATDQAGRFASGFGAPVVTFTHLGAAGARPHLPPATAPTAFMVVSLVVFVAAGIGIVWYKARAQAAAGRTREAELLQTLVIQAAQLRRQRAATVPEHAKPEADALATGQPKAPAPRPAREDENSYWNYQARHGRTSRRPDCAQVPALT